MNHLDELTNVPFYANCGVELTLVPKNPIPYHTDIYPTTEQKDDAQKRGVLWQQLTNKYKKRAKEAQLPGHSKVYQDPGCVEVPSPILRSWAQAERWYNKAIEIADDQQLTPHDDNQADGGGHIHMDLPLDTMRKVIKQSYHRPYLPWIFLDPQACQWGKSIPAVFAHHATAYSYNVGLFLNNKAVRKLFVELDQTYDTTAYYVSWPRTSFSTTRAMAITTDELRTMVRINSKYRTLEWRAFDSAATWDEQAAMLAFYHRYAKLCADAPEFAFTDLSIKEDAPLTVINRYKKFSVAHKAFKQLLNQLELPYEAYSVFVERNLESALTEFSSQVQ